ncbi:FKBP-type peptidyl-prolyl cis-trans isomerase [Campylobacter iguaniorum]|uniref:Peptidyl-prolyl cis-trans isomerase n=1 Tax=Campylobacter iguaniorum TaxID=1244531 RepID=A0A076FA64_9BACT|nr:FKBP-type peptidyl-prolyl cis-trans isomerase [Campylobacter iguaniorum]AII14826.1 FKBP-type peptidyl-prolyl cis-trans isomerase [Campylobacter iguaniorum]ALV24614.1 FKBP-type peptidyl-prolyl cis-trans isomerase [Campylobacter iguaniorum]
MQKQLLTSLVAIFCLAGYSFCADLKTQEQKESYSIGASTGSYISNQILNQEALGVKSDINAVVDGFMDALSKKQKLSDEEIITLLNARADRLNEIVKKQQKEQIDANLKAGKEFMAKNAKSSKVKTTKSGVQYEVIKPAKGEKPKPESIVLINYKAYLVDGKVFDDTYEKKSPAHLSMINIIDGLKEALLLMNTGSKYKVVIPSNLAYGEAGMGEIPGGSTVVFEIELMKVLKPGELANSAKALSDDMKNFHDTNTTK